MASVAQRPWRLAHGGFHFVSGWTELTSQSVGRPDQTQKSTINQGLALGETEFPVSRPAAVEIAIAIEGIADW